MAAYLLPTQVLRQLRPDSDLIAELAAPSPGCRTRFVAVWSELDVFVVPQHNAKLEHPDLLATNYLLNGVGHLSLPVDSRDPGSGKRAGQLDGSPFADLTASAVIGPSPTSTP